MIGDPNKNADLPQAADLLNLTHKNVPKLFSWKLFLVRGRWEILWNIQSILIPNKTNTNTYLKGKSTLSVDRFVKYPCEEYMYGIIKDQSTGNQQNLQKTQF